MLQNLLCWLREEKNWVAEATEDAGAWEAAHTGSSPDKWLLREVAERRGASAKTSPSEEVAQQRKVAHSSIHPSIHPSITSFVHSFLH